jgi:8-oxo-dGTP diphosphatase
MEFRITRALIRCDGKYLLLKRAKDPIPSNVGKWECSGGRIENETPSENVIREVFEETGLKCKIVKELPFLSAKTSEIYSECNCFLLEADSSDVQLSEEHSEFKWVDASEVKNMNLVMFASLLLEFFNNEEEYLS